MNGTQVESFLAYISIALFVVTTAWLLNVGIFVVESVEGYMAWGILVASLSGTFMLTIVTNGLKRHLGNQMGFGLEAKFIYASCFGFLPVLLMSIDYTN